MDATYDGRGYGQGQSSTNKFQIVAGLFSIIACSGLIMSQHQYQQHSYSRTSGNEPVYKTPNPANITARHHNEVCDDVTTKPIESVEYKYTTGYGIVFVDYDHDSDTTTESRSGYPLSPPSSGPPVTMRIVGGTAQHVKTYPFFVAIAFESSFYCGGSILSNQYILSAAHCFENYVSVSYFEVYVGISKFSDKSSQDKYNVGAIMINSNYNSNTFEADIAILKLQNSIPEWTDYIQPACIKFSSDEVEAGVTVKAVGMGATSESRQKASDFLLSVPIKTMTKNECNALFGVNLIQDDMICAGDVNGGNDACQGDSGGPLVQSGAINGEEVEYLIGTVSFGVGCARPNIGAAYASVNYYKSWISSTINHFDLNY